MKLLLCLQAFEPLGAIYNGSIELSIIAEDTDEDYAMGREEGQGNWGGHMLGDNGKTR
jgi:hypothetical protein